MILKRYSNRTAERIDERAQEIGLQFIFVYDFYFIIIKQNTEEKWILDWSRLKLFSR